MEFIFPEDNLVNPHRHSKTYKHDSERYHMDLNQTWDVHTVLKIKL